MGGVDHAIHDVGVAAAGDVVEASAEGPVIVEEMEFLFELKIQREVIGKAFGADFADDLLLIGYFREGKAGAGFGGVSQFELMKDGKIEEGKISPREKTVGSVPGIRAGLLRAENWIRDTGRVAAS